MARWNSKLKKKVTNPLIDTFLLEVIELGKKHQLSISHEDNHGAFKIVSYNKKMEKWLWVAHDSTDK